MARQRFRRLMRQTLLGKPSTFRFNVTQPRGRLYCRHLHSLSGSSSGVAVGGAGSIGDAILVAVGVTIGSIGDTITVGCSKLLLGDIA